MKPTTLTTATIALAKEALAASDGTMATVIAERASCQFPRRQPPFHVLMTSIINQQLSQQAARSISDRIKQLTPSPFAADHIRHIPPEQLRQTGLSASKIKYLQHLITATDAGLIDPSQLRQLADDVIIERLVSIHGIGQWTAEMFLMFGLRRANILSLGDAGLRRAARNLYSKRFSGDDATVLKKAARNWQPWCSVACWYLWQSLKPH